MEEVIARFPHLAEYIFNSLSNKTLADCRKVNKAWKGFIDSERFYKKFYKKRIEDGKRRQQSASIQNLQKLLPHNQGEKQHTAEYIYQLEQEKTRLVSQNSQLERLYRDHQQQCLSSQSSENSGRQNGSSNNTMSPKLKRQKLISNPSNLGGSNPGGSNLGGSGSNPGSSNPGGSNTEGSNPGSSNPGGTNPNHNNSNQNPNTAVSDSELSLLDQLMTEQRLRIRLEARIKTLEKQVASVASNKDPKIL